jgi:hypothetical protein
MFGGYDGPFQTDRRGYLTMFGGSDLTRPTLARRIVHARQRANQHEPPRIRCVVITLFGGTDIRYPTLADEYLDLMAMLAAGTLSLDDWDRDIARLRSFDEVGITSLTLFGGLDEEALPEEDQEIDALAMQRHLGNIPPSVGSILEMGVGMTGPRREAIIRRAASTTV